MNFGIRLATGLAAVAALAAMGCTTAAGEGKVATKTGDAAIAPCGSEALIDDCEDQNNQVIVQDGRSGYWYTYVDEVGSTIEPTAGAQGGQFVMSPGGANGSQYAARMSGKVATGGTVYCGMGFNLTDPKDAYDASKYGGVKFYAKKAGGSTGTVRLKIPDSSTDPDAGRCQECYNDFGATMELTGEWTEYVLPFYLTKQEESWGDHFPAITPSKLYGMQWQTNIPGAAYDIWVDDISFVGCDSVSAAPAEPAPAAAAPPPPAEPAAAEPADDAAPAPVPVE